MGSTPVTTDFQIRIEPLGREISCRDDQPILDACLRAGIWIPHDCTHGTCATCKFKIVDGSIDHGLSGDVALGESERAEGKALLCCALPKSDVTVEADVEHDPDLIFHPVRDFEATVRSLEECARETLRLTLDLDQPIAFSAGQYVNVRVPESDAVRAYSIASTPDEHDHIELQIRRTPEGVCTDGWIFGQLKEGDTVKLAGPFGRFMFRTSREDPAIFVAGGTGLAPITSMIRHHLAAGHKGKMYLYQGARTRADIYDVEVFRDLEKEYRDQFVYRPALSEEDWDGAQGLITDVMDGDFERCRGHVGYVCGPPPMVEAAVKTLVKKRVAGRDVYREEFFDQSDKTA